MAPISLGTFLEISIGTPDVLASLEFYESLGFAQLVTGEAWTYPYAVISDGRLTIGLHQSRDVATPAITYVRPDLALHTDSLKNAGYRFTAEHLGAEMFNRATLIDPAGQSVTLLEARTYSPPPGLDPGESECGYFLERGIPVREFTGLSDFWEPLGFVGLAPEAEPFPRLVLASDVLNIAFYRTRSFREPVLTFCDPAMNRRIDRLRARGYPLFEDMPDALEADSNAIVVAPEGTRLLLLTLEA